MAPTVSDVREVDSQGWEAVYPNDPDIQTFIDDAEDFTDTIYNGRVATLPQLEGPRDLFVKLVAAHFAELGQGGEAQSENSSGGSVNYQINNPETTFSSLQETRYGRMADELLRDQQGIGIVRTR